MSNSHEITAPPDIFDPPYPRMVFIQHETAHSYFDYGISDKEKKKLSSLYKNLKKPYEAHNGAIRLTFKPILIFKESYNLPKIYYRMGHPGGNEGEFFSSCTTTLKCLHKNFFNSIEKSASNIYSGLVNIKDYADLIFEAAYYVVLSWNNGITFPKEVYSKLGIRPPKE